MTSITKIRAKDNRVYNRIWDKKPHYCEECNTWLGHVMRSIFMSHIMSKGAHPEFRHEERNFNLLCPNHHRQWETGSRKIMKIYEKNQIIIQILKDERNETDDYTR